ncbi:DUF2878 domain-containing protein [Vibrio zhanjiangensis]|uniref:DUF2878 domain-containing protein n=1 Tax=Vibrio zhanjiangensis TaxID=1046128 RepID=UPI0024E0FBE7|nr:DUF2878 domain-containing protein [Vibrio zhanjiangensis]
MKQLLIASTWFQVIWLCAVVGNYDWQSGTLGLVIATLVISAFKGWVHWRLWTCILVMGVIVDFANLSLGLFQFEKHTFPLWLTALWMLFAWYAHFLLPFLTRYPQSVVSIVGGITGALSYLAGEKLGAVAFGVPLFPTMGILLVEWFLIVSVIVRVYRL